MIDLHAHSTASDGSCTPERLIELAFSAGLSAIALTDHDTLSGLEAAAARARELEIRFVPGVEIEIDIPEPPPHSGRRPAPSGQEGEFHLLGLGLHGDRSALGEALVAVRKSRQARNLRIVEKLQAAGFPVTMEELAGLARGDIVSRAHIARLLAAKRIVTSTDQAFSRYLGKGMPFYEHRECLPLRDAAALIRRAGGVPVVAHPSSLRLAGPALAGFLDSCRDQGVGGVEAFHPNHTLRQARKYAQTAHRLGLLVSAGSDFHGENMPQRRLGHAAGGREIPDGILDSFALHAPPA